ncbi:hypothetical protein IEQ34_013258 [Dendrobium chrysotoxum]|uniref:Uncharacterized protein n=1 Tax=Dendrobium chrysotoxum TaxID=161865 RepID=A0AAV7GQI0_DENCH|nr:hypothetical protein IEQ34_013258 [Dendrobium chrysotoxum]
MESRSWVRIRPVRRRRVDAGVEQGGARAGRFRWLFLTCCDPTRVAAGWSKVCGFGCGLDRVMRVVRLHRRKKSVLLNAQL